MRNRKIFSALLILIIGVSLLVGCGNKIKEGSKDENKNPKSIKVFVPEGIPSIAIAKLKKENTQVNKDYSIEYEIVNTSDALVSKVLNNEAEIAIVPSNLPAQSYNKGLKYKLAGTVGWGNMYMVSNEGIDIIKELKGKDLYTIGKGLTPDITLRYILKNNNIDADKDVNINYLVGATELAPTFISGKAKNAVIPEPMLSNVLMKSKSAKIIGSLNDQWKEITKNNYGYPQSSLIIKEELVDEYREFVDDFIKNLVESIEWAKNNIDKLGDYSEELKLSLNKENLKTVMERSNLNYIEAKNSKEEYKTFYKVLFDFQGKSIGGKIPDEKLYME
ncbi:ABC transporter substrate-binding protein [Clostridium hydrogeniformans]|uniref:ABC transporter substrate-binding protein n=1 Tax=Clostridium hydrogeniformans TaxID=349933 RepID=UPI000489DB36|nr:ABC transporter substrate-binding protein [Clostridium hydrogeniformans]